MEKSPKWLLEIIKQESFMNYHAYYKVVRHNHKPQGIIAYARLSNSEQLVEKYTSAMKNLVPEYKPNEKEVLPQEVDHVQSSNLDDYLGKGNGFYKIHGILQDMYKNKYNGNINEIIKNVCPPIIDGPLYGALHGLIQMAYGLAYGTDDMVIEGISWMYQQYSPLYIDDPNNPKRTNMENFGKGKVSLDETIKQLQDETLVKNLTAENKKDLQLRKDTNFFGVFGWSCLKYHSDFFMDLTNNVKLPDWFKPEEKDPAQLKKLLDWLIDISAMVYAKSSVVNDFFLLHGITGSWSARKVLPLLDFDSALLAFRATLAALFMVYAEQNSPVLSKNPEDIFQGDVDQGAWDKLINEVVKNEDFYEYHIYKVIQCLYERWQENPDGEYAKFYFAGACVAKDNIFFNMNVSNKFNS